MRSFREGFVFRVDLHRSHQPEPEQIGFEGQAGLLDEQMPQTARGKKDAMACAREGKRLIQMRNGIVDDFLNAWIRQRHLGSRHERPHGRSTGAKQRVVV